MDMEAIAEEMNMDEDELGTLLFMAYDDIDWLHGAVNSLLEKFNELAEAVNGHSQVISGLNEVDSEIISTIEKMAHDVYEDEDEDAEDLFGDIPDMAGIEPEDDDPGFEFIADFDDELDLADEPTLHSQDDLEEMMGMKG